MNKDRNGRNGQRTYSCPGTIDGHLPTPKMADIFLNQTACLQAEAPAVTDVFRTYTLQEDTPTITIVIKGSQEEAAATLLRRLHIQPCR